jgi:hypothetical protein
VSGPETPPASQPSATVGVLVQALQPFANAADRLDHYGDTSEQYDGSSHSLYASRSYGSLLELLDGKDGEPLTIAHLRAAREALATLHTPPPVATATVVEVTHVHGWRSKDGTLYQGDGYPVPLRRFALDNDNCVALMVATPTPPAGDR